MFGYLELIVQSPHCEGDPLSKTLRSHGNLVSFCQQMRKRLFPETHSSKYRWFKRCRNSFSDHLLLAYRGGLCWEVQYCLCVCRVTRRVHPAYWECTHVPVERSHSLGVSGRGHSRPLSAGSESGVVQATQWMGNQQKTNSHRNSVVASYTVT